MKVSVGLAAAAVTVAVAVACLCSPDGGVSLVTLLAAWPRPSGSNLSGCGYLATTLPLLARLTISIVITLADLRTIARLLRLEITHDTNDMSHVLFNK